MPLYLRFDLRNVLYSILVLQRRSHIVRKLSQDFDSIHAGHVAVEALILCDPRFARVCECDNTLEDGRCTALDLILGMLEMQKFFAVGATFVLEALDVDKR